MYSVRSWRRGCGPTFGVGVGYRGAGWGGDRFDPGALEHGVEGGGVLAGAAVDHESEPVGEVHEQVSGGLGGPGPGGVGGAPAEVQAAVAAAEGDPQAAWNRILATYLDGDISLGRAAQLLGVDRFELTARLGRLELPLHFGSPTPAEARQELARLDA